MMSLDEVAPMVKWYHELRGGGPLRGSRPWGATTPQLGTGSIPVWCTPRASHQKDQKITYFSLNEVMWLSGLYSRIKPYIK
jgi:hypothetical protein